jgi:hypothetical protein
MPRKRNVRRWYAASISVSSLPETLRRDVSCQMLAHYRKIADLPRDVGEDLDRRAAPLGIVRWIAWGAGEGDVRARHAVAVKHHDRTGRWPGPRERAGGPRSTPQAA